MEVEINWNGKKGVVELKPITFGELLDITKECTKTKMVNNIVVQERDESKMSLLILMKSIEKAPFEITEENIRKLNGADGLKLMEASAKINSFLADTGQTSGENVGD